MSVVGHRGAAVRRPADQARSPVSLWWRGAWGRQLLVEVAVVVGGYLAYKQVRSIVRDHQVEAFANAARIIRWERAAGMFTELHLQELVLGRGGLIEFHNRYYVSGHVPPTVHRVVGA